MLALRPWFWIFGRFRLMMISFGRSSSHGHWHFLSLSVQASDGDVFRTAGYEKIVDQTVVGKFHNRFHGP